MKNRQLKQNLYKIALFITIFFGAETVNAQAVILSDLPENNDTIFTGNPGLVASSTGFGSNTNIYHARSLKTENIDLPSARRIYLFMCGNPSAGLDWYIERNGIKISSGRSTTTPNCNPNFYQQNRNTFLNWSYVDIPNGILEGDTFSYRHNNGSDFRYNIPSKTIDRYFFYDNSIIGGFGSQIFNFIDNIFSPFPQNHGSYFVITDNTLAPDDPFSNPLSFDTRFTGATATGTASNTISFDINYILETAEYTANTRPDAININILADGFLNDSQVANTRRLILPLVDGAGSKNLPVDYSFPDGDYIAFVNFWNINNDFFAFVEAGATVSFTVQNGAIVSTSAETSDGQNLGGGQTYQDCSLTNIGGCFINALIYTFVPADNSLSRFSTLYERIENKPPFGYVVSINEALRGLNASGTPAVSFGAIPFQNALFDPFKSFLVIGLWVLYAIFFMSRLNKLDI